MLSRLLLLLHQNLLKRKTKDRHFIMYLTERPNLPQQLLILLPAHGRHIKYKIFLSHSPSTLQSDPLDHITLDHFHRSHHHPRNSIVGTFFVELSQNYHPHIGNNQISIVEVPILKNFAIGESCFHLLTSLHGLVRELMFHCQVCATVWLCLSHFPKSLNNYLNICSKVLKTAKSSGWYPLNLNS